MSMIGKSLGSFECTALLGKGGMGEVYKAKDQKLGRDVAIKVLPKEFAKDADRVARFQREAKLLASLNHPNIAAIYGLEESDGTHFLVLELIEGDTLADRLKRGAVPVEESLKLALQIAEALEAAHENGVIHRDLKPANIKVTPDEKVKVLDFGLAKAFAGEQGEMILSDSPTLSVAATQQGVILGTAAYMSPEQAKGKTVDKKTDIWAFGVVLFEMLTGKPAFQGDEVSEILASVIKGDTNLDLLPANTHSRVREVLTRCLQKDLRKRYPDIANARYEIEQVLVDPNGVFVQPILTEEPRAGLRQMLPWIASALVLVAIIAGVAAWTLKPTPPPEPRPVMRFDYHLPEGQALWSSSEVTISKDGKIAYVTQEDGLYLKDTLELNARLIQGADDSPMSPFFSPDGKWIGYWSGDDSQLKKIAIAGGTAVKICDVDMVNAGASWGADDMIVFSGRGGILQVSADGGTPEEIVKAENERLLNAQILPNGKSVLFNVRPGRPTQGYTSKIVVQSLESGERKELFEGENAQYLSTGHIVYTLGDDNLYAIAFDLDRLEKIGGPIPMVDGVFRRIPPLPQLLAISDSGTLIYVPGAAPPERSAPQFNLVWVDRQGKVEEIAALSNDFESLSLSPDGTKVAMTIETEEGASDIYILDFNNENMERRTFNGNSADPLWTPDGERIVFVSGNEDKRGIYCRNADGTGKDELLALMSEGELLPRSWADDDGKILVITHQMGGLRLPPGMMLGMRGSRGLAPKGSPGSMGSATREKTGVHMDISTLSMEGEHEQNSLLSLEDFVFDLKISPDGRWMAYSSTESGYPELYVRPFPDAEGGKWQVSAGGAMQFAWSTDGRGIFYFRIEDGSFIAVEVEAEPTFEKGKSEVLFNQNDIGVHPSSGYGEGFNISPDGRFLMIKQAAVRDEESMEKSTVEEPRKINIVLNWFEELKERVPAD